MDKVKMMFGEECEFLTVGALYDFLHNVLLDEKVTSETPVMLHCEECAINWTSQYVTFNEVTEYSNTDISFNEDEKDTVIVELGTA